ncbi:MAG: hypothetical protein AB9921_07640 [Erysipelotrichaceae bacterium]
MNPFLLESRKETLGTGVIIRISVAAHTSFQVMLFQIDMIRFAAILAPSTTVKHQAFLRLAIRQRNGNQSLGSKDLPLIPVILVQYLRRSHASNLFSKDANIVPVSKRLGHSDLNIALKVYTHLMKESEEKLMTILDIF